MTYENRLLGHEYKYILIYTCSPLYSRVSPVKTCDRPTFVILNSVKL